MSRTHEDLKWYKKGCRVPVAEKLEERLVVRSRLCYGPDIAVAVAAAAARALLLLRRGSLLLLLLLLLLLGARVNGGAAARGVESNTARVAGIGVVSR